MRRTTTAAISTMAIAGALTFGSAYAGQAGHHHSAAADSSAPSAPATGAPAPVLNKNGHEVSAHAAHGQARATEARARHLTQHAPTEEPTSAAAGSADTPADGAPTPRGNGPDEHAGTRPDTHASASGTDHGKDGLEHGTAHAYGKGHGTGRPETKPTKPTKPAKPAKPTKPAEPGKPAH